MKYSTIQQQDPEIYDLINKEQLRQKEGLELIPSENYTSPAVMEAMGSILTNKYSEGYPNKRYYAGNEFIDQIELLAQKRVRDLFGVPHANVQPYSGSPANLGVYLATCQPGDSIMGLNLPDGGHLTHGWKFSLTSTYYKSVPYHVTAEGRIDFDEVWRLAKEHRPKLIWCGATAYVYKFDYEKFAEIADSVGAYLVADIAHVAGLIVAGVHPSPVPYAHIVTTTTHKTLRGPRGGLIMTTKRGLDKDKELSAKIDNAIIPGSQGGPHNHQTAAIAIALAEAANPEFKQYGEQIVANAKALAESLKQHNLNLVGGGTENHLLLLDLVSVFGPGGGIFAHEGLDAAGMTANKNTIPADPSSPFYPSGLRIGTPALTTRGMKEADMAKVGEWLARVLDSIKQYRLPGAPRSPYIKQFKQDLAGNSVIKQVKQEIKEFCQNFPVPGIE